MKIFSFLLILTSAVFAAPRANADVVEFNEEFIAAKLADMSERMIPLVKFDQSYSVSYRAVKTASVAGPTHSLWDVSYSDTGLVMTFIYDQEAMKNPERTFFELASGFFLSRPDGVWAYQPEAWKLPKAVGIQQKQKALSPYEFAELLVDAQTGSPAAQSRWADLKSFVADNLVVSGNLKVGENFPEKVERLREEFRSEAADFRAKALEYQKKQARAFENWKSAGLWDQLEQEPQKLEDLLLKNDRKGVAKLIRSYLPWTLMEKVESEFWKTWLEAIEHPDRAKQTVAYRGVDYTTDKVQRRQTVQGEALGFFSTLLTKNQGSYTRRLRSISTKRVANGDSPSNPVEVVRMTKQMRNHSSDPAASSFLSFSIDPATAQAFTGKAKTETKTGKAVNQSGGGFLAVSIDSRRIVPNLASIFEGERELLVPLIVFPDEVVGYKEGKFASDEAFQKFLDEVTEKTGREKIAYDAFDGNDWEFQKKAAADFVGDGLDFLKKVASTPGRAGGFCSRIYN